MNALQSFSSFPRRASRRHRPDVDATVFFVTSLLFLLALVVLPGGA